ncbi:hypothetical protein POTOM_053915 [Populus tomentosa]|uniref:Exocyst subunit Exo70 family protein n=1 Tax=Populus tomentosa TaxID=118781 RepID=A0A8X8BZP6_POPTO|nr:hypothetical protein POTOM_053915 [Populus tomentosa]
MTNTRNEHEVLDGENHEEGMITQAEFRIFQHETQQALQTSQTTLARLVTGNNQRCEDELAYEEELSDDEEYVEHMFRHNRQRQRNVGEREPQTFRLLGTVYDYTRSSFNANPIAGGGIHPLTKYVMNYLNALTGYRETLNFLLKDQDGEDTMSLSPDINPSTEEENAREGACDGSPLALHFRSVASILECNLDDKAKLYRDASLQHIFLMNNIHYMAQKVVNSNLQSILGDGWIRKHNWKFQQHEINYERNTWSSILAILKEEGNSNSSRTLLKERFRNFYTAFEEVYRTQTAWSIPNAHLREDMRISTSLKVIQAYRTFVGRHTNQISDKHIKYSADDLPNYLLDLFEGSQRSLHNPHRRS